MSIERETNHMYEYNKHADDIVHIKHRRLVPSGYTEEQKGGVTNAKGCKEQLRVD